MGKEPIRDNIRKSPIVFATYSNDNNDLYWVGVMSESLRTFGGKLSEAPIKIFLDAAKSDWDKSIIDRLESLKINLIFVEIPPDCASYPYAGKVFAAGIAENQLKPDYEILAWLDPDMVFVGEPAEFLLNGEFDLGYRPVQLVNVSSHYNQPVDDYWGRIYSLIGVQDSANFPMTTTVDNTVIRPHFNAGMVIVRPDSGILGRWGENFKLLGLDSILAELCAKSNLGKIFLHQAALAATIMTRVQPGRMRDLPSTYNYAVFLTDKMVNKNEIMSLDEVIMFRHDQQFVSLEKLELYAGSTRIFRWLKERWRQ